MFSVWTLLVVLALYMGVLFFIALWGDRNNVLDNKLISRRWVYALALSVYCTSWTFYGAVGRAADSIWSYLPIYLGPLLIYTLGIPLLRRIVDGVQHHNLTSVADFIAARYGRDRGIASLVTVICVVAVVPYIALQLRGIAIGVDVIADTGSAGRLGGVSFSALVSAACLAVFAILFGTRHISSRESQQGLLVAVAFESLVKLAAFIAVGILAWSTLGTPALADFLTTQPDLPSSLLAPSFATQTLLAGIAVLCLPRQFHVAAVEYTKPNELELSRWVFPSYLIVIALFVLPIVALGLATFPQGTDPDGFVLSLPTLLNRPVLSLLVFLGGVSAASAMVIVSSIALGTMISNELVLPRLLKSSAQRQMGSYSQTIKLVRRSSIVLIVVLAYGFYLLTEQNSSLAATGLLAFAGIAQLAPSMLLGIFWDGATRRGAFSALCVGAILWAWIMLLPVIAPSLTDAIDSSGIPAWLTPAGFFGLASVDVVDRAAWSSLSINALVLVVVSIFTNHRQEYRRDAGRFLLPGSIGAALTLDRHSAELLLAEFFGKDQAQDAVAQPEFGDGQKATYDRAAYCERLLSGVMGAATARRLVAEYSVKSSHQAEEVLNYATQVVDFSRELLQASLQNIGVAVSVIDANQRLVAWNQEYKKLFHFPESLLQTGVPIEKLVRFNAERGLLGQGNPESLIAKRLKHLRAANPYRHERKLPNQHYLEIRGAPMPGGGFITTFTDISAYKALQHTLEQANAGLESRVSRRTGELEKLNATLNQEVSTRRQAERQLQDAKALAEQANASKTRFLAAVTHDLMQPLNSARLFSAVLSQEAEGEARHTAANIEQSLENMEEMLSTLLDISKLDAGVLPINRKDFSANDLLQAMHSAHSTHAAQAGIQLSVVDCHATINSDPSHLRRVLQNFLVNAIRYSGSGSRIVLGARRCADGLRFDVVDNGPGISDDQQGVIFEEFRRGDRNSDEAIGPRGSGLGLSISRRLAALLGHEIGLQSSLGAGSRFSITVPRSAASKAPAKQAASAIRSAVARRFDHISVLCIDNEQQVLAGMHKLLSSWGCDVTTAESAAWLLNDAECQAPQLLLVDFHLEHGESGVNVIAALRAHWGIDIPAILITADHTEEAKTAAQQANVPILRKPLKPASLGALMSRLLAE